MIKTTRYEARGLKVVFSYDTEINTPSDRDDNIALFVNGERLNPMESWQENDKYCLKYRDDHGNIYLAELNGTGFVYSHDVTLYGKHLKIQEDVMLQPGRQIEHLAKMSQYPPIGQLGLLDFCALKGLTKGAVISWPEKSGNEIEYYLRVSDKPMGMKGFTSLSRPNDNDFIRIDPKDIQLGDDILIVRPSSMVKHIQPIKCVTAISTISNGSMEQVGKFIEGHNATWTSFDIDKYREQHILPILEQTGLSADDMARIFTPTTTWDEFNSIGYLMRFNCEISDQILTSLAYGATPEDILANERQKREETIETPTIGDERR